MSIIINQIAILVVLALIGFTIQKTGYLPPDTGRYISKIIIRITSPCLIVTNMSAYAFTSQTVKDGLLIAFLGTFFMMSSLGIAHFMARGFHIKGAAAGVFKAHCMLGNVGYLGMPLLNSLYGQKGLIYANFFAITLELLLWTVGIFLVNSHKDTNWRSNLKHVLNPATYAFVAGLILALINIQGLAAGNAVVGAVYKVFYNTLSPVGNITLYLVMIFIGMSLGENSGGGVRSILTKGITFFVTFYKLLILPGIAIVVFLLMGDMIDPFVRTVVILELAMPCASVVAVQAEMYGSDYKQATDNIVFSTIGSMLTLPIMLYIVNLLV